MSNGKKVVVGMSGGVDSSVTAYLLKEQGYDVIGVFMKNWEEKDDKGVCVAEKDYADVIKVCEQLDIPYYSINFEKEYWDKVFTYFLDEYKKGRTPNPDIMCNKEIKFKAFLEYAEDLGADYVATGHYARVKDENGQRLLLRGVDNNKDQTYFLYNTSQEVLSKTIFPLADLLKDEVREIAKNENILTYSKKDSEEICFVQNRDHGLFIKQRNPELIKEGYFIDEKGEKLGKHNGIVYYTVGQRKGLGIALGKRVFVSKINAFDNTVTLSDEDALYKDKIKVRDENFIPFDNLERPLEVNVKVRHGQSETKALLYYKNSELFAEFKKPVRAPNKGQSAVFYLDDIVVGGGIIDEVY